MADEWFGQQTVRVEGYRKLIGAIKDSEGLMDDWVKDELFEIGERVAVDVRKVYGDYSVRGAQGVTTKVWKSGTVLVVQTLRKGRVDKRRKNFGGLMMRKAFLPAIRDNEAAAQASMEELLDKVVARFGSESAS